MSRHLQSLWLHCNAWERLPRSQRVLLSLTVMQSRCRPEHLALCSRPPDCRHRPELRREETFPRRERKLPRVGDRSADFAASQPQDVCSSSVCVGARDAARELPVDAPGVIANVTDEQPADPFHSTRLVTRPRMETRIMGDCFSIIACHHYLDCPPAEEPGPEPRPRRSNGAWRPRRFLMQILGLLWFAGGPAALMILFVLMMERDTLSFGPLDASCIAVTTAMITTRWICFALGERRNAFGGRLKMKTMRQYSAYTLAAAGALWAIANAVAPPNWIPSSAVTGTQSARSVSEMAAAN